MRGVGGIGEGQSAGGWCGCIHYSGLQKQLHNECWGVFFFFFFFFGVCMCDNQRAQGHLGPLHNNKVSWGRKVSEKRHTHTGNTHTVSQGPLVTHAWPVHNALLRFHSPLARQQIYWEKRIWEGWICQDCGNSQIPSYTTKDWRKSSSTLQFSNARKQASESMIPWLYHLPFSEPDAGVEVFYHFECNAKRLHVKK